jgi:methylphosphotriester-DNA--protein-cysteine methyltransferase
LACQHGGIRFAIPPCEPSRFHFCRAFKESTGLSPHAWLRRHRLEQAMKRLRDTGDSVVSIAAARLPSLQPSES